MFHISYLNYNSLFFTLACDNCTQTLLDSIEALTAEMNSKADLTELTRIPQPFPVIKEFSDNATKLHNTLQNVKKSIQNSKNLDIYIAKLEETEHNLFTNANKLKEDALRRENEALSLSLESATGLEKVSKEKRLLAEQVEKLDEFARGEKHLSAHRTLKEARHLLKEIKEISLIDYITGVTDVSDSVSTFYCDVLFLKIIFIHSFSVKHISMIIYELE